MIDRLLAQSLPEEKTEDPSEKQNDVKNILNEIPVNSPAEKTEKSNETELKTALKNLVNLHANQRKTNELVFELGNIKSTLHSELRNMAETEVIAYQAAALAKLKKIKEMLKNNNK